MENTNYVLAGVVVVALIIIGAVIFMRNSGGDTLEPPAVNTPTDSLPVTINAKHLFADGVHRYHGVVTSPTPCYDVSATVSTNGEGSGMSYVIHVVSSEQEGAICAQVLTDKEFDVSFTALEDAKVEATLNGKPATLNVIEVYSPEELVGPFDFKS